MKAQHIIQKLKEQGWSDAAIAQSIGCSQPTITRIRNGQSDCRESTAYQLEKLIAAQPSPSVPPTDAMQRLPVVVPLVTDTVTGGFLPDGLKETCDGQPRAMPAPLQQGGLSQSPYGLANDP